MADDGPIAGMLKRAARRAGRRYGEIRSSYRDGREAGDPEHPAAVDADLSYLPRDEDGRAKLVCRRHAEKRSVAVDDAGRPSCFDPDHPDCRGCVEDVRDGQVETW